MINLKIRTRLWIYVAILHVLLLVAAFIFREKLGLVFFLLEALILLSAYIGIRLVNKAVQPLAFLQSFSALLEEEEFNTRLSPVGQFEMDTLIETYNKMLSALQEEYLRLGEQRGFLEKFLEATPVGIVIMDFDQQVSLINQAAEKLLGSSADLQGQSLKTTTNLLDIDLGNMPANSEKIFTVDGGRRVRCVHSRFLDRGFYRSFYLLEELTQLLNRSERKAYEQLIRMMSHEVNNTVATTNSLIQSCEAYLQDLSEEDRNEFQKALDVIVNRNTSLNQFVQGFANVVHLPKPVRSREDLVPLLDRLQIMFQGVCSEQGILWQWQKPEAPVMVNIDVDLIEQVLINIARNGIDAIQSSSSELRLIEIRIENHNQLVISDSGDGLKQDSHSKLFTPFYTTKPKGQGLGLTLVREILDQHGFGYSLKATGSGLTEFRIVF